MSALKIGNVEASGRVLVFVSIFPFLIRDRVVWHGVGMRWKRMPRNHAARSGYGEDQVAKWRLGSHSQLLDNMNQDHTEFLWFCTAATPFNASTRPLARTDARLGAKLIPPVLLPTAGRSAADFDQGVLPYSRHDGEATIMAHHRSPHADTCPAK